MGYGPLLLSWLGAVPGSIASGALLGAPVSAGSKAGAFIFLFLTSIFISMDIGSRAGTKGWAIGLLAVVLTVVAYAPWYASISKDPKNKARAAALPISGILYAVVLMAASLAMYGGEVSRSAGLQGAVITLMYVFISSSLGYQAVRAKSDPVARAQSIYMAGLLLLITLFDVLGAKNAGDPPVYGPKTLGENFANKASAESVSEKPPNNPFPAKREKLTEAIAVAAAQGKPDAEIEAAKKALANFNAQVART
jgi:hypothetical protein